MSTSQSGLRPGHSTVSAATLVLEDVLYCFENTNHCAALFIDLSKAFDMVDHFLLLQRLSEIGLDQASCNWLNNY